MGDEGAYETPKGLKALQAKREAVRSLLRPARLLRSEVLIHSELLQLYEYSGITGVTEEHIDELSEYLDSALPDSSHEDSFDASTLPAVVRPLGRGLTLSVAASTEMLQERTLIKVALANFYRLKTIPSDVWLDDEQVTGAWLARSDGPNSINLLRELSMTLSNKPNLLPDRADFGGVDIRPNPHRN